MKHFIVVLAIFLISSCESKDPVLLENNNIVPNVKLKSITDGTIVQVNEVSKGRELILFLFDPDCPFCNKQIVEILDNIERLKQFQICLITNADPEKTKNFYTSYSLDEYSNIDVLLDQDNRVATHYNIPGVPYILVYDKKMDFRKKIIGKEKLKTYSTKGIYFLSC
ncbi:peroxiredoxin family protein [Paraflavitalea speifideaquila]|uniref:peroxiredoxin family protein n=1 Tax=Paraflavitalea speifideaquila TaxID=3076558 RepID=UPI0028F16B12|nr:redoxin domain-containing protein [Paraflavitalea speifideiaquila]